MSDAPAEQFYILEEDDDLEGLEAELLADTPLNFSRDEAAAVSGTL